MYCIRAVRTVFQRHDTYSWRQLLNRKFSVIKDGNIPRIPNFMTPNEISKRCSLSKFRQMQCNTQDYCRNFSKSNITYSNRGSNQNREKIKNFLLLGMIAMGVLFVFYMQLTMKYAEDVVFVPKSEDKKK